MRCVKTLLAVGALCACVVRANAAGITGQIDMYGNAFLDSPLLGSATRVTAFANVAVGPLAPTGTFAAIPFGSVVDYTPFSWNPVSTLPISPLWSVLGRTFALDTMVVQQQNNNILSITGTGRLNAPGFDQTDGNWTFTIMSGSPASNFRFNFVSSTAVAPRSSRTLPATFVTTTSAQLNGFVDPKGLPTTIYFEYGPTTAYGTRTLAGEPSPVPQNISFRITRLAPNATYHYRIVATNASGVSRGEDILFSTTIPKPYDFHGRVLDPQGRPISAAIIEARTGDTLRASASTTTDGTYRLATLPEGIYDLQASKPAYLSDIRTAALHLGTAEQNFLLSVLPLDPEAEETNTPPAFIPSPEGPNGSKLVVYDGSNFVANLAHLDTNKMTILLTHGWIPATDQGEGPLASGVPGGWVHNLAETLSTNAVANIVAWDWERTARALLPPEDRSPEQGIALGRALQEALGVNYRQHLHVFGHSLGTLLNGYAVDYIHGYKRSGADAADQIWPAENTHVTMSDEAAISRLISKQTLAKLLLGGGKSYIPSVILGWKNPVPHDCLWIDNYISSVGRYHPEAVNVLLQRGMLLALAEYTETELTLADWRAAAVEAHSYPVNTWYPRSVASSSRIIPGFGTSFEYSVQHPTTEFPPPGLGFVPGIAYRQTGGDDLTLELVTELEFALFYPAVTAVGVARALDILGNTVEWGVDQVVGTARKFGDAVVEVGQEVTATTQEAVDRVADAAGAVWDNVVDSLNRPNIRIQLRTGPPGFPSGPRKLTDKDPTNTPAAIWLPVLFPPDTASLTFDFVVDGNGKADVVVFNIGGTNLFSLPTKYIPTGVTNASPTFDVAAYSGTTNTLMFGLLGGTSTNCTLRIERVRFLALPPATLSINVEPDGKTVLSWPSTATGFALETSRTLSPPQWGLVTNYPTLFGNRLIVTNSWDAEKRFFRLHRY